MTVGTVSTGAMGSAFALASWFGGASENTEILPTIPATREGALFDQWPMDGFSTFDSTRDTLVPPCEWWNQTVQYESPLCSHFSLSRVAVGSHDRAIDRAARCAANFETECVLSPEIGLSIPAAFVYDEATTSMKMIIAPRLLPHDGGATGLLLQDPSEAMAHRAIVLNRSVRVEYLPGGKRSPVTEVLVNHSAWCVQLLRLAFVDECWESLD